MYNYLVAWISIITPTYNRAHCLPKVAESIFEQTCEDWEWIIVDDGSTDNTRELVKSFCDNRVKYIYQENQGAPSARNTALKYINCNWITNIDSDNDLHPDFIETTKYHIDTNPQGLFFLPKLNKTREYFENGKLVNIIDESHLFPEKISVEEVVHENIRFDGNGFVYSKKIIDDGIKYDNNLKISDDFDLFLTIANKYPTRFVYIPEFLINYHLRYGVEAIICCSKMMDHAYEYEYIYHKHRNDLLMSGQTWYQKRVQKYIKLAEEAGEIYLKQIVVGTN